MASNEQDPAVRFGDVSISAFSIGGSGNTNTVHHGDSGADRRPPSAEELLEAVRDLRAALARLPRSPERRDLDAELDEAAAELEETAEIRTGLPARLRAALVRWAPLVESVAAATALGGLLTSLGG
ncbi:hypothetical protein [Streptomyces sp. RerS4]|uniref:hypothetical protein n=1 Tax=Streptomyces sp. RerS4 TaxID=2942449 RepID=UPI00201C3BD5|nr:hypothetical protein [Streptomyces sp. RerS4]UQX02626.1 hypothetical protein M4D82_20600 [Streptomyces sp. RerS4]